MAAEGLAVLPDSIAGSGVFGRFLVAWPLLSALRAGLVHAKRLKAEPCYFKRPFSDRLLGLEPLPGERPITTFLAPGH
jgi:hypothetical protein